MTARRLTTAVLLLLAMAARGEPIPHPSLDGLEPAVAEQVRSLRDGLDRPPADEPVARAAAYAELGALYHALAFDDAALACYRAAEDLAPGDGRWPYLQGVLLTETGELDAARRALLRAIALAPELATGWARLGRLALDGGDARSALLHFRRALAALPDSAAALAGAGQALLALERPGEAVDFLERALEAEPRANRLHYPLAMAYRSLGEEQKMREHLDRVGAVGVTVDDPIAEYTRSRLAGARKHIQDGNEAYRAGDYAAAVEAYERAAQAAPAQATPLVNLGAAQAANGDPGGAEQSFRRALAIEPGNATALENLVTLLLEAGETAGALSLLDRHLPAASDNRRLLHTRAKLRREAGRPSAAAGDFRRLTELETGDAAAWEGLVVTSIEAGDHERVPEILDQADAALEDTSAFRAELVDALGMATGPENAELARHIALELYRERPGADHAARVVHALLQGSGDCRAAADWLSGRIEAADTGDALRRDLRAVRGELEDRAHCASTRE